MSVFTHQWNSHTFALRFVTCPYSANFVLIDIINMQWTGQRSRFFCKGSGIFFGQYVKIFIAECHVTSSCSHRMVWNLIFLPLIKKYKDCDDTTNFHDHDSYDRLPDIAAAKTRCPYYRYTIARHFFGLFFITPAASFLTSLWMGWKWIPDSIWHLFVVTQVWIRSPMTGQGATGISSTIPRKWSSFAKKGKTTPS